MRGERDRYELGAGQAIFICERAWRWLDRDMRVDMHKVICERPRPFSGSVNPKGDPYRKLALEDQPAVESMKARHANTRPFNENLRPLEKWLRANVGRPWDKVYSEACEVIKPASTVRNHVKIHLLDMVARHVVLLDGVPCVNDRRRLGGGYTELRDRDLFVDPANKLLRVYRRRHSDPKAAETVRLLASESADPQEFGLAPRKNERCIKRHLYRKLSGCWFEVRECELLAGRWSNYVPAQVDLNRLDRERFYQPKLRTLSKRQLSKKELARLGLKND